MDIRGEEEGGKETTRPTSSTETMEFILTSFFLSRSMIPFITSALEL